MYMYYTCIYAILGNIITLPATIVIFIPVPEPLYLNFSKGLVISNKYPVALCCHVVIASQHALYVCGVRCRW